MIAGRAAEVLLCERAQSRIIDLAGGEDLAEIGLWADRIRSNQNYADTGPWHYMNIRTGGRLTDFEHPPEGDVLWAIGHFSDQLGDETLGRVEHVEALKFLVHFIVDLHQPLHVGLAEDRGGNTVNLEFRGEDTNLHRFWDTHAIESSGLSVGAFARSLRGDIVDAAEPVSLDPLVWAAESLALRARVYDFGRAGREPPRRYIDFAGRTTRERLSVAARRLAGTLNDLFC